MEETASSGKGGKEKNATLPFTFLFFASPFPFSPCFKKYTQQELKSYEIVET